MNLNILAALFIFRRDSDSLFVFDEVLVLAAEAVDGVLPLVCLLSLELATRINEILVEGGFRLIIYLMFLIS